MGSMASTNERSAGFQMESVQSPMSLPKQFAPHFSYAAETKATSVELMVNECCNSLISSARLSRRPSHVMTAPELEMCGWLSRCDSFVM